ncbi:MAG: hypothetical protein RLN90_11160 [Balneolaceae bacterium]
MKNLKFIFSLAIFLTIGFSTIFAQDLICEPVKSRGEGHWPIPEDAFTRENALERIGNLKELIDQPVEYIDDLESIEHNTFVIFKGYILKRRIIDTIETDSVWIKKMKTDFCDFLKDEAYFSH